MIMAASWWLLFSPHDDDDDDDDATAACTCMSYNKCSVVLIKCSRSRSTSRRPRGLVTTTKAMMGRFHFPKTPTCPNECTTTKVAAVVVVVVQ
jgi:hypothetical protein